MLQLSWQSLLARRRRFARTSIAVVLGVSFLVGTLVLGDTIAANFDDLFTDTAAGTDVVVRSESPLESSFEADPGRRPVDVGLVDEIAELDGVRAVEPQIVGYGQILGADGDPIGGNGPPRLAGNWVETPELNPYRIAEGREPEGPDEVVINRGAAEAGGLVLGDRTLVQVPDPIEVRIVGIATFGEADGFGEVTFAAFTLDAARELLMRDSTTVSSIAVTAADGTDADDLRAKIAQILPEGVEAVTGEQLTEERLDRLEFLGTIRVFLVAFAAVALLVAGLSINNAFSITVAQRTRELALLRSVGASARQVRRLVTLEALFIGAASSAVGVVAGLGVAAGLKGVFDGLGLSLPAGGLTIDRSAIVVGLIVGVVSTLLAARVPARRASRVAPIAALRASGGADAPMTRRRVAAAAAGLVAGGALSVSGAQGAPALVGVGALLLVIGVLLVAPVLMPRFATAMGAVLRRARGLDGELAAQNARRSPRRSASTATPLVVGVAVVTLFTVLAASARSAIERDVRDGFGTADLAITTPVFGGGVLSPRLLEDLDQVDAIDDAMAVARGTAVLDGVEVMVTATDAEQAGGLLDLTVVEGSLSDLDQDELVVSEARADDQGWTVGSPVEVTFLDGGAESMAVGAVVEDAPILPGIVISTDTWFEHTAQPAYSTVFMTLADGVTLGAGREAVTDVAARYSGDVQDREEFSDAAGAGLDMLLGLVYVLLTLAIVISLLGIANAMAMAIHERRREIGLLRAVGQTRRQARSVVRLESVIVAAFGTSVGLVLGAATGELVYSAAADGEAPVLPAVSLIMILFVGLVAGAMAARRPARQAARLDVLDALSVT